MHRKDQSEAMRGPVRAGPGRAVGEADGLVRVQEVRSAWIPDTWVWYRPCISHLEWSRAQRRYSEDGETESRELWARWRTSPGPGAPLPDPAFPALVWFALAVRRGPHSSSTRGASVPKSVVLSLYDTFLIGEVLFFGDLSLPPCPINICSLFLSPMTSPPAQGAPQPQPQILPEVSSPG